MPGFVAGFFAIGCAVLLFCPQAGAQTGIQASAETLREQLRDVQARQAELQVRIQRLELEMQPENIERSLATTGSTRPEELREQRRRELETQHASLRAQLDELETSWIRLESAIAAADAAAARQSAAPAASSYAAAPPAATRAATTGPTAPRYARTRRRARRRHKARHRA